MSATSSTGDAPSPEVTGTFARKATGLVREVPLSDILAFNAAATGGISLNFAISVFVALTVFPRANLVLAMGISIVLSVFVWVTFSLLAALMPRVGGDYTFNSRLLHPVAGLASNFCYVAAAVLAAGANAYLMTQVALGPAFAIIGTTTNSSWFIHAATAVTGKAWTFWVGAGTIVFVSALCAAGTRIAARVIAIFFWITLAGFFVAVAILLFKTRTGFVNDVNHFAAPFTKSSHSYQDTVKAGVKVGLGGGGYSSTSTFGAIYYGFNAILFTMGSMYLGGEMRGAGRRKRQLTAVLGTGIVNGVLLAAGTAVVLHTAGYTFVASASAGNLAVPAPAFPNLFAAIASGSSVVAILVSATFIFAVPCALFFVLVAAQRAPFAWALDGLMPQWVTKVNSRTHTPIVAIVVMGVASIGGAAWAAFSKGFITVLSYVGILGLVMVLISCVAAALMPLTRKHLYRNSIADWRWRGIPILPVAAVLGAVVTAFGGYLLIHFHTVLGIKSRTVEVLVPLAVCLAAPIYYYAARAIQRGRGIDLDLVYRTIPPE
jgi:basic amino acid/polyamine antiporter, APA family